MDKQSVNARQRGGNQRRPEKRFQFCGAPSGFDVICEMEESKAGYNPELSYGSHIFQDLVEAEILYTAVFNNSKTLGFYPEKLNRFENVAAEFDDSGALSEIVKIFKVENCTLYHDINKEQLLVTL